MLMARDAEFFSICRLHSSIKTTPENNTRYDSNQNQGEPPHFLAITHILLPGFL
jgi:hypothetical protein